MTATVAGIHLGIDTHGNRPAANTVPDGSIYSCSTHSLIYKSNFAGNSWATWASLTGTGLTDPMTTRGDSMYRNASNVTDRLPIPAAGQVLGRVGSDLGSLYPPGYEFDYMAFTSPVSITATSEATANTVVTGSAVTYDGSTVVMVEFFCPYGSTPPADAAQLNTWLYDGSSSIGRLEYRQNDGNHNAGGDTPSASAVFGSRRLTPSNASHTYSVRSSVSTGTGSMGAGAGGNAAVMPGFIRITKV